MCVVSMVSDHYYDKWKPIGPQQVPNYPPFIPYQELEEFRKLLERARECDKKNNQPECDNTEKFRKLKELLKEAGHIIDDLL